MTDLLPTASKLAAALRNMPCTCRRANEWPIFASVEKATTCARCAALQEYEAWAQQVGRGE